MLCGSALGFALGRVSLQRQEGSAGWKAVEGVQSKQSEEYKLALIEVGRLEAHHFCSHRTIRRSAFKKMCSPKLELTRGGNRAREDFLGKSFRCDCLHSWGLP